MDSRELKLPRHHRAVVDRYVAACLADERVVAAFIGGSYARGTADAHSDLDLGLITTDEAYDAFWAGRSSFIRLLGEPAFLEDFDYPNNAFFILSDGAEGELAIGRESRFEHIHRGPYIVLLDKKRVLLGTDLPGIKTPESEQTETLRRLVDWFWHDLSHFATAMARGQLWWAYGQLEALRLQCVNLARLSLDYSAAAEGYEKAGAGRTGGAVDVFTGDLLPNGARPDARGRSHDRQALSGAGPSPGRGARNSLPGWPRRLMCDRLEQLGPRPQ